MTTDPEFTEDVHSLFMQLTGLGKAVRLKKLLQSPLRFNPSFWNFWPLRLRKREQVEKRMSVSKSIRSVIRR